MRKLQIIIITLVLLLISTNVSAAQEPPYGQIAIWPDYTAPGYGWSLAAGQSVNVADYPEIFDVIGYMFGGSGSTFNLPNLNGRVAVGYDASAEFGTIGQIGGEKTHTLTINEMPQHAHFYSWWEPGSYGVGLTDANSWQVSVDSAFTGINGYDQPHNNLQPYITLRYIIYTGLPVSIRPTPTPQPIVETLTQTDTYSITVSFDALQPGAMITKTLPTSDTALYTGNIGIPPFYAQYNVYIALGMLLAFGLVGAAVGKPTMFIIAYIGLLLTGVFNSQEQAIIQFSILALLTIIVVYKFLYERARR
jgi:microcystin-dependent protein